MPRVSVIIPTWNAGRPFEELLSRLWGQSLPPHEIIVIDSSSSDGTADAARRAGAVVLTLPQQLFDHGGARNRAASAATGDVLMFMTQDAMPADSRLIEELVRPLADRGIDYAFGRQLHRDDAVLLERVAREHHYPPQSQTKSKGDVARLGVKAFFCSNVCSAITRETFERMGKFPEPVMFNEDLILSARCILSGGVVAYAAEAKVIHSHNYSLRQLYRRFYDNGVSIGSHPWMSRYVRAERAGAGLLRAQLHVIWRERRFGQLFRLAAESVCKYAGFKAGVRKGVSIAQAEEEIYGVPPVVRRMDA